MLPFEHKPMSHKFILLSALFISALFGQVYDYTATPGPDDTYTIARFRIYLPEDADTSRGIYVYLNPYGSDSRNIVNDPDMRSLCSENQFSLMGAQFDNMHMESGIGDALLNALSNFTQQSGHPEIEHSPLFFEGYSWGGQWSYHFTLWQPGRIIGFVTMKGGYHDTTFAGGAVDVPGLMFIGEDDLDYRVENLTGIFLIHRPLGAPWSLAMEPDAAHNRITNRHLLDNYFLDIISRRLPDEFPTDEVYQLNEVDLTTGWLGDRREHIISQYGCYPHFADTASWSPSEDAAIQWQTFVSDSTVTDTFPCASDMVELTIANNENWNIIGLPLDAPSSHYLDLFQNVYPGTCYSFDGGYTNCDTLFPGVGYLLRFSEEGSSVIIGYPLSELTISVRESWNLISGLSVIISAESLYSSELIEPYTCYGLDGGYVLADSLRPGKGYWIYATGNGEVTISR